MADLDLRDSVTGVMKPSAGTHTNNALHVIGVDSSGNPGALEVSTVQAVTVTLEGSTSASAGPGILTTITGFEEFNTLTLEISAFSATSIDVTGSVDGTNYVGPLWLLDKEIKTTTPEAAIKANGLYELKGKFKTLQITQVGAGTGTILRFIAGIV